MRLLSVLVLGEKDHPGTVPLRAAALRVARSPLFILSLILLLTFGVYAPSLNDWFQNDDLRFLPALRSANLLAFTRDAFDFRDTSGPVPLFLGNYRPLHLVAWLVRYQAFGLNPLGYHVLSIALHLANVALLWLIAVKLTRRILVAHIAALVFALHPALTLSVAYISGVTDLETTFASLVSLWLFMKYVEGGRRAGLWYVASLMAYAAALLFHLKAAPVLVALGGYYLFVRRPTAGELARPATWGRFVPFAVLALSYIAIQLWVRHQQGFEILYGFGWHNVRNFLGYLAIAVFPLWREQIDVTAPFPFLPSNPINVVAVIIGLSVLYYLLYWVFLLGGRRLGERALPLAWFLATILPLTSFTIGVIDRDLYVAGPAWALLVGLFGAWAWDRLPRRRLRFLQVLLALIAVAAITLASMHTIRYEQDIGGEANQWEGFIEELRENYPVLPGGSKLYVVGTPLLTELRENYPGIPGGSKLSLPLIVFDDLFLRPLIDTFYRDVELVSISPDEAARLEPNLGPTEHIFRYQGQNAE